MRIVRCFHFKQLAIRHLARLGPLTLQCEMNQQSLVVGRAKMDDGLLCQGKLDSAQE